MHLSIFVVKFEIFFEVTKYNNVTTPPYFSASSMGNKYTSMIHKIEIHMDD